jgi:hypothetical protein
MGDVAADSPLAVGSVERFDSKTSIVVVLGQTYSVSLAKLFAGHTSVPAVLGLRYLAGNRLLRVDGVLRIDGSAQVTSLTVLPDTNVGGATQLYVAGVVKSTDPHVGKVEVGELTLGISPSIPSSPTMIQVGDEIAVLGVQPSPLEILLAESVALIRTLAADGAGTTAPPASAAPGSSDLAHRGFVCLETGQSRASHRPSKRSSESRSEPQRLDSTAHHQLESQVERLLSALAKHLLPMGITPAYFRELSKRAFVAAAAQITRSHNGCNDPPEPAQAMPLVHTPQRMSWKTRCTVFLLKLSK